MIGGGSEITFMSKKDLEIRYPELRGTFYSIASSATPKYNCFAWAAGDTEQCWGLHKNYYWPPGIPREATLEALIRVYETLGYTICDNAREESGFLKIAIYVDTDGVPTHAARELHTGDWSSKLEDLEVILHDTLEDIEGGMYGEVKVILKRPQ